MNKKLINTLLLLFAILLSLPSIAQERTAQESIKKGFTPQHEFNLSIGAFNTLPFDSFDGYFDGYHDDYDWNNDEFTSQNYERLLYNYEERITTGAISVGYSYSVLRWLSVGATFSYAGVFHKQYDRVTNKEIGNQDSHNFMLIPTVRFTYLNRPLIRLYSQVGVGLGVSRRDDFNKERNNDYGIYDANDGWFVPGQMTFFGISLGRKLFGFTELGVGSKGVFVIGVGYKFNNKKN